jgi:hypothetical protein
MADNIEVTAGTGTVVHADEYTHATYGAGKTQLVKLALGAPGTGVEAVAGAGNVSTGVQRVTLAADDPAVVDLAALEVLVTATNAQLVAGATALGKAEDAAHTTADVGIPALAVRRDTAAVGSGTDGDYSTINVDASGKVYVNASVASGGIASGGIAAGAIAAGATSVAENEDVASADGDRGVKIMFKRLDTPANSSGTDGDYEQPQMSRVGLGHCRRRYPGRQ